MSNKYNYLLTFYYPFSETPCIMYTIWLVWISIPYWILEFNNYWQVHTEKKYSRKISSIYACPPAPSWQIRFSQFICPLHQKKSDTVLVRSFICNNSRPKSDISPKFLLTFVFKRRWIYRGPALADIANCLDAFS